MRFNRRQVLRGVSVWVLLSHVLGLVPVAFANPEGGAVVGGAASIDQATPGLTSVHQSSDRAIINWRSFSNSATERIRFLQPGASSAIVNRVTGAETSVINGALEANGHVFLLNPNGVLFGKTATVNVNGLTATTLDMDNNEFMSGSKNLVLRQDPGKPLGAVVNRGSLTAGRGGVTLVAPLVNNEGTITTRDGGNVNLGAGTEAILSIGEESLLNLKVRATGKPGDVKIDAEQASELLDSVVNNSKFVEAGSVRRVGGEVFLGGAEGLAMNSGTIRADGAAGQRAGRVLVDSTQLTVAAPGSVITANGVGEDSDGGDIELLSRGRTVFAPLAKLEARGGDSGDGGFVEVSGDEAVISEGHVDTRATDGVNGEFVLDPDFLVVVSGASGTGQQDAAFAGTDPVGILAATANTQFNTVTDGRINQQLATTDVILEATGHIKINSGVSINLAGNHNLYFHVTNTISDSESAQILGPGAGTAQISNLNNTNSGKIVFKVDSGTNLGKIDLTNVALDGASGGVFISAPGNVTLDQVMAKGTNGIINVQTTGQILRSNPTTFGDNSALAGSQVYLKANGIGSTSLPVRTATSALLVDQSAGGDVFITNTVNAITVANIGGSGSFSLTNQGGNIVLGGVTIPSTTISTIGQTFNGATGTGLTAVTGTITLDAQGTIGTSGAATLTANTAKLTATNGIASTNTFATSNLSARNTANGDINLVNSGAVVFDALNSSATGKVVLANSGGDLTVGSANVRGNDDVTLSVTGANNDILLTGTTTAGAAKTASFTSGSATINGAGLVTARTATFNAPGGIGNTTPVATNVQFLNLKSIAAGGDIAAGNTGGAVTVAAVSAGGNISITESGGTLTVGTVTDSGVSATGAGKTVSLVNSTGDVVVSNAVSSSAGNTALVANGNISLAANVTTGGAGNGAFVDLIARAGTITQSAGTVTSGTVVAAATGGIGAANQRLALATQNLQLGGVAVGGTAVTMNGDAFVANTGSNALVFAGTSAGAIDITQSAALLTVGSLTAGAFAPAAVTVPAAVNGLTTTGSGKTISLVTSGSGAIQVAKAVTTNGGDIGMVSAAGIGLADNVTTQSNTGASQAVMVARSGAITRTGGTVTAGNVALSASGDIGSATDRVRTSTSKVQLGGLSVGGPVANSGSDFLANSGVATTVAGSTTAGDVDVTQDGANLTVGSHTIGAFAPASITSAGKTGIAAGANAGDTVSLVTLNSGDVIVSQAVSTTGNAIGIVSAGGVQLAANVTTGSSSGASTADVIARSGTITRTSGQVTAGGVAMAASGGIGSATQRVRTSTSQLRLGGLQVGGTDTPNGGDDFVENVGSVATTLAALNANGVLDVTQDGANLTVGSVTIGLFEPQGASSAARVTTTGALAGAVTSGNGKTISLVTKSTGDIVVSSEVKTTAGNIGVIAADGVTLGANVTTQANTGVTQAVVIGQNGAITRSGGTVTAGNVAMASTVGIGAAAARVQTSTSRLQLGGLATNGTGVTNLGDDFVENTGAALTVAGESSGALEIKQNANDLTVGTLTVGNFAPAGASSAVSVVASERAGLTGSGASRTIALTTAGSGNISIDNQVGTNAGDIAVVAAGGVALGANVTTGANTGATILDVIARGGTITRSGGTLTAGGIAMSATGGIGTATARVQTSTSRIQLGGLTVNGGAMPEANNGNDFLANSGVATTVAGANGTGVIDVTQTGANLTIGSLTIGAFDPFNPDSVVRVATAQQNGLTANESISLATFTAGNITISNAIATTSDDIAIVSAKSIVLGADVSTGATGGGSLVDLIAQDGTITRTGGTVTAGNVAAAATIGIGAANARVRTSTSNLMVGGLSVNGTSISNGGDDFFANTGGVALTVAGSNGTGNIDVTQDGANLTVGTLNAGAFAPQGNDSAVRVTTSARVGVVATGPNKQVSLVTENSGNILVNNLISTATGDIGLVSAGGIALGADVTANQTAGVTLVDLVARSGAITRTAGTVTAGNVAASATGGIGSATARVQTSTSNLQLGGLSVNGTAVANGGNDFVRNTGGVALTVAGNDASGDVDVLQEGANLTVGTLTIGAFSPAGGASAARVTSTQQSGLLLTGLNETVSLVTATTGDVRVSSAIATNAGDIGLVSAKGVALGANVSTGASAGGTVVDVIARDGAITRTGGIVTGGNVAVAATNGIGSATARVQTSTANLRAGGLSVNGTAVNNGGDDFLANSGPATTLTAVNTTGAVDVTQTGADLTVGTHSFGAFAPAGGSSAASVTADGQTGVMVLGAGQTASLVTQTGGNVVVNGAVITNAGSVGVVSAAGVTLAGDVSTGSSANAAQVDLVARDGAITRTGGTVTSGNVAAAATGGIGAAGARLVTATSNLQLGGLSVNGTGVANAGDDFVSNTSGALTLAAIDATGSVNVIQNGGGLTVGDLALGAFVPAGVSSAASVTGAAVSGVTAEGAGRTIALVTTGGNLTVASGVRSSGGDVGLVSAGGITLAADVTTGGTGAGIVDLIARAGGISRVSGTVTAGGVAAAATGGIGSATARLQTRTGMLQLGGLSVDGTAVANAGDDFVNNTGVSVVAAGGSAGRVDVTQAGGQLTVGSTTLGTFAPAGVTGSAQVGIATGQAGGTVSLATLGSGDLVFVAAATSLTGDVIVSSAANLFDLSAANNAITAQFARLNAAAQIGSPAAPLGVTASTLVATAGGSVYLRSRRAPTTLTGTAGGDFTLVQTNGDLLLDVVSAGGAVDLQTLNGSIKDATGGSKTNVIAGAPSRLVASGTIGERGSQIDVDIAGSLTVGAGGTDGRGDSVNIGGEILPVFTLLILGELPGQSTFNGRLISGPELTTFQASPAMVTIPTDTISAQSVQETVFLEPPAQVQTSQAYNQDDYIEPGAEAAELAEQRAAEKQAEEEEEADEAGEAQTAATRGGGNAADVAVEESAEVDAAPAGRTMTARRGEDEEAEDGIAVEKGELEDAKGGDDETSD